MREGGRKVGVGTRWNYGGREKDRGKKGKEESEERRKRDGKSQEHEHIILTALGVSMDQ